MVNVAIVFFLFISFALNKKTWYKHQNTYAYATNEKTNSQKEIMLLLLLIITNANATNDFVNYAIPQKFPKTDRTKI